MAVLKTTVDNDTKERFHEIALSQGMTEAELLRSVVLMLVDQQEVSADAIVLRPDNTKSSRITVGIPGFLVDAVKTRASSKGMAVSRWVAALVQSNVTGQPVMTDKELLALQASGRELAAIGRNVNQIAKALNIAFEETDRVKLKLLSELSQVIDDNRSVIRALVRTSQNAWDAD